MTLKDELSKLYSESTASKKRYYLDKLLPERMKEAAKDGRATIRITKADVVQSGCSLFEIQKWCDENGFDRVYGYDIFFGAFLTICLV